MIGLGCFSWGVVNFIISYRQTKITRQRLQILYLLVGIIAMFVIGLVLHVANSFFQFGYSFFFVASLYSLLISFFFALAIVKYRLLDIHFIIRGSILYSLLSGLVLVIYVLFIKNVCDILAKKFDTNSLLVESAFVLVLVFLLRPLERRVEEFIDRFFYRDRYLFRLKFFEFTRTLLEILDLPNPSPSHGGFHLPGAGCGQAGNMDLGRRSGFLPDAQPERACRGRGRFSRRAPLSPT